MSSKVHSPVTISAGEPFEELNRLRVMAHLMAATAHEVNNSLQVIEAHVEMLGSTAGLPAPALDRVQKIGTHAERASRTVADLASYVRGGGGSTELVDLLDLVERAVRFRGVTIKRAGILVHVDRGSPDAFPIRIDRQQMLQAMLNLLLMSEAALTGRSNGLIDIALLRRDHSLVIHLAHNGAKISQRAARYLQDASRPIDGEFDEWELGLWIAARLAERAGGRLNLDEQADEMTRLELILPMHDLLSQPPHGRPQ